MTFAWKSSEMSSKREKKGRKKSRSFSVCHSEETFDHLPNENL